MKSPIKRVRVASAKRMTKCNASKEQLVNSILAGSDNEMRSEVVKFITKLPQQGIITKYQLERCLIDHVVKNRYLNDIYLGSIGSYKMERGLKDIDSKVRESFSRNGSKFYTKKQISRGLKDESIRVRISFAKNRYLKLLPKKKMNLA